MSYAKGFGFVGRTIDLNADVGEGVGDDDAIIPHVTSVNVACGAHAGDERAMAAAVRAAIEAGATIGAHPGHADRHGFGRVEIPITPAEAAALVRAQIERLEAVVRQYDARVGYLKPHGALYHQIARDAELAEAVVAVAKQKSLAILGPPRSALQRAAENAGIRSYSEAFADRRYLDDGQLMPRSTLGAVLTDPAEVVRHAIDLAENTEADSLCLHGDNPAAAELAAAVRRALGENTIAVRPFVSV